MSADPHPTEPEGEEFGPFVLERLLGRGGMAEVFVAHKKEHPGHADIVLKRIRPDLAKDQEFNQRFILEAQVASRLSHPNLVRFREFGQVGECRYIVMDRVRGHSLGRILDRLLPERRPAPLPVALHVGAGILSALAAMHGVKDERGRPRPMLHRDVTPANVILTHHGRPVLIDFGITKDLLGPQITLPGKVIGTARYMSPEHKKAEFLEPRADVYSVSVILYELLTGRHPWKPLDTLKELLRISFDPPEVPPEVRALIPGPVLEVVLRGLACDPKDRFAGAEEMLAALSAATPLHPGQDSLEAAAFVASLALPADEDLDAPVVDKTAARQGEDLRWTRHGGLAEDGHPTLDMVVPPAQVLSVPPLPPPREAALAEPASSFEAPAGRPVWLGPLLLILAALVVTAGLIALSLR